jgi:uncharacterized protein YegJ (DUF2314 family)
MFGRLFKRLTGQDAGEFTVTEQGDAAIVEAVAAARATLPVFWTVFEARDADDFQLKVGLTTPAGATEHVWIAPSAREGGKVTGVLAVQPFDLDDVDLGDEVVFDGDRISDWSYFKNGLLYGAYTQRAMLDRLPRDTWRELEAVLSPTPLEPAN